MRSVAIRKLLLSLSIFVLAGTVTGTILQQYLRQRYQSAEVERVQNIAGSLRAALEEMLATDLLMIRSTAAYISVHPDLTEREFERYASAILGDNRTLTNLAAARQFRVTYVYPREGNEGIVGVDYRDLPEQFPLVLQARNSGDVVIAGPVPVVQGGMGIIARAPVFVDRGDGPEFWGIVSSLIDFETMIAELDPWVERSGVTIALRGTNGAGAAGSVFLGEPSLFEDSRSVLRDVTFPNGSWQVAVVPAEGWSNGYPARWLITLAIAFAVAAATVLSYRLMMNHEVIRDNEARLRDITMASSDIIWETDRNGIVTHIAGRAEAILGYTASEIVGRNISGFFASDEREAIVAELEAHFDREMPLLDYEAWADRKDRGRVCLLINAVPLRDRQHSDVIGFRGVSKDITVRKGLQEQLERNIALLDLFFGQSLDGFFFMMLDEPVLWDDNVDKEKTMEWVFDHQRMTKVNQAMLDQYRTTESGFLGLTPREFFAHDLETGKAVWRAFFDSGHLHVDTDERRFDGSPMTVTGDYIIIRDNEGRITGHFGVQRDVTADRDAEASLERYIRIVDEQIITSQTDLDGIITYASSAFSEISGYSKEELLGKNHNVIRHPDMDPEVFKELWETITAGTTWHGEIKNLKKDGGFYWVHSDISPLIDRRGETYGYMAVRQDITAKKELEHVSITDRLTQLYNRQKLDQALSEQSFRFLRYHESYAVIIFDIDHFKAVNDTYGHLEGDRILKEVATLVSRQVRHADIVGRWGGEEFLIICPHTDGDGGIARAEALRKTIREYEFGLPRAITASFGVADLSDSAGVTDGEILTTDLLRRADRALYTAKEGGRDRVERATDR